MPKLLPHRPLSVVGVDFETYFDAEYSLRNRSMSTSLYVRDPRFQVHTVAIREEGERRAKWYSGDEVRRRLEAIDWGRTALLAHHAQFDGLILTHHFGITPRYYCCTLSMARALHGNDIPNDLDTVAQYYNRRGKIGGVLEQTKGLRTLPAKLLRELGRYNAQDVDAMWGVFADMIANGYPADELDLVDLTVSLFTEPVLQVNRELAQKEYDKERRRKEGLLREVCQFSSSLYDDIQQRLAERQGRIEAGKRLRQKDLPSVEAHMEKVVNSNPQFANLLESLGVAPPMKISPTTKEPTYAFAQNDLDFQALAAHPEPRIRKLVETRLRVKSNINETRAAGLLVRTEHYSSLPIYLNYCGAHTMRWTGGDKLNPQNFPDPAKGGDSRLRECLLAPPGFKIVVVDSSQIEARKVAWLADQRDLLEAFADPKRDPYCEFASELYGFKVTKAKKHKQYRFVGKVCILGLGYGMGAEKLQFTLATGAMGPPLYLELEECERAVALYRRKNHKIRQLWKLLDRLIVASLMMGQPQDLKDGVVKLRKGRIEMPNGLALHYPNLRSQPTSETRSEFLYKQRWSDYSKIYGALLLENIIQCLARITVGEQALEIAKYYRTISLTHDEDIYLAPASQAQEALDFGLRILSTPPAWGPDIPLAAEGDFNDYYLKE